MLVGQLTTHVLDTAHGRPGTGMAVTLYRRAGDRYESIKSVTTNADGRVDAPLLEGDALSAGRYRLVFAAGAYFRRPGEAAIGRGDSVVVPIGLSHSAAYRPITARKIKRTHCPSAGESAPALSPCKC